MQEEKIDNPTTINGVALSKSVLEQLRLLGMNLNAYTHWELEAAMRACAVDCNLIDNPNAPDFDDQLEAQARSNDDDEDDDEITFNPYRLTLLHPHGNIFADLEESYTGPHFLGFREQLKWDRERRKLVRAQRESLEEHNPH